MPAKDLSERLDVWNLADKFTFVRNPWEVIYSGFIFSKYTGPRYGWNNPDNYDLRSLHHYVNSLIDIHGTTNFNKEIYTIDNKVVADVYDISNIQKVMSDKFGINEVPKLNVQKYEMEYQDLDMLDKYIYEDYEWEINEFKYRKPTVDRH